MWIDLGDELGWVNTLAVAAVMPGMYVVGDPPTCNIVLISGREYTVLGKPSEWAKKMKLSGAVICGDPFRA